MRGGGGRVTIGDGGRGARLPDLGIDIALSVAGCPGPGESGRRPICFHPSESPGLGSVVLPPVQFFSRNLLAYLETLVAFSPYYRAHDGRMARKMEAFHLQAVERYISFKDHQLHQYITRKLTAWCKQSGYHPKQPSVESEDDEDIDGAEGDIVDIR